MHVMIGVKEDRRVRMGAAVLIRAHDEAAGAWVLWILDTLDSVGSGCVSRC